MNKKTFSAVLLATLLFGATATSCMGQVEKPQFDASGKTVIQVSTYNKGVGVKWLQNLAKRFEEAYATTPFEEGKMGVAVDVQGTPHAADILLEQNLTADVYFTELMDYFTYVRRGKVQPISDVVKADMASVGESGKTIEGKMVDAQKDFLTAQGGEYYAIPFYDGFMGFVYDVDVFEKYGYYFNEAGNFVVDGEEKSTGIDKTANTYDDGLPRTYAEFKKLVEKISMDSNNMHPFVYSNEGVGYYGKALMNWWSDYEGKTYMQKNWELNGETDYVSGFDGNGNPIITTTTIDSSLGMDSIKNLQRQPGKYYALQFIRDVVTNKASNLTNSGDFKSAQYKLIASGVTADPGAAMLAEGVWWENEAYISGTFDGIHSRDLSTTASKADYKKSRRFAFMPVPKVSEDNYGASATQQTLYSGNDAMCFISSASKGAKLDAAKEFLKFAHTDRELSLFNVETSIPRALKYKVEDAEKAQMSHFGKSVIEMKNAAEIVYPYSGNAYYKENSATFTLGQWAWRTKIDGVTYDSPFEVFAGDSKKTAKAYFEGLILVH